MYKQCNIYLLPINDKSNIKLIHTLLEPVLLSGEFRKDWLNDDEKFVNLYITDDSEIKEGNWCIDIETNIVIQIKWDNPHNCKKIIATTDKLILDWDYKNDILSGDFYNKFVPQIPKQFIEYYISEYNSGRKIDKVDVEFEGELYGGVYAIPKISANNEISIKPVEEKMYSREEVVELIKDFTMSTHQLILNKNPQRHEIINTWFKENLK